MNQGVEVNGVFCPNCGQRLERPDDAFCPNCGTAVRQSSGAGPTSGPAPAPPSSLYPPSGTAGPAAAFGPSGAVAPVSQPWPGGYAPPPAPGTPAFGAAPGTPVLPPGQPGTLWATPASALPPAGYAPPYTPPDAATPPLAGAPTARHDAPLAPSVGGSGTPPWAPPPTGGTPPSGSSGGTPPARGRVSVILAVILAVVLVGCLCTCGLLLVLRGHRQCTANCGPSGATPPTVAPGQTIMLQDPLTADTNSWSIAPPNCQFGGGGYEVAAHICDAPIPAFGDGQISVAVRQASGTPTVPMSIVFRRVGAGDFYAFGIAANGDWGCYRSVNGHLTPLDPTQSAAAIHTAPGSTNTLLVRATGHHFVFFVNGVRLGQADDSTFATGRVGLRAGVGGQAIFNDFKATTA